MPRRGIPHHWRVEEEDGAPVVHILDLDPPTRAYVPTGIHRRRLRTRTPFPIEVDLTGLVPARKG